MLVFARQLVPAATRAGMQLPTDEQIDNDDLDSFRETHPHFYAFCRTQLARPMSAEGEHLDNAKLIASLSSDRIKRATLTELIGLGLRFSA